MHLRKMKVTAMLLSVMLVLTTPFQTSAVAGTIYESANNNNSYTRAELTYDDYNNYGTISSVSDRDWWKIIPESNGLGNVWLGNIPGNCDYNIYVYNDELVHVGRSTNSGRTQELVRVRFYAGKPLYVWVQSIEHSYSNDQYLLRFKNYPIGKVGVFSFVTETVDNNGNPSILNTYRIRESATTLANYGFISTHYANNLAQTVRSVLPENQVVIISGHGNKGHVVCDQGTKLCGTYNANYTDTGIAISTLGSNSMSNMNLIVFDSCFSGVTGSISGNLVDQAIAKGAKTAIGWNCEMWSPYAELFVNQLIYYLDGKSVEMALVYAQDWALNMGQKYALFTNDSNIHVGGHSKSVNLA
ncbi:MAG: hypothetical protein IJN80_00930 [Clostridia bacterium]|nr:hypothetical protein [Clostridia bacterium]